ncbi:MAG: hypothetical protein M1819_006945 [Sarea resinae]|nr:MAG: hypothetical protein M1819_006945 [Sarea resinae]
MGRPPRRRRTWAPATLMGRRKLPCRFSPPSPHARRCSPPTPPPSKIGQLDVVAVTTFGLPCKSAPKTTFHPRRSSIMATSNPTRLTVLISGNGTNLQALIDACRDGPLDPARIIRVISNRKSAYGLQRAENASIPTAYHNLVSYKKLYPNDVDRARSAYDADLASLVLADEPDLVVCAGFMHILTPLFLDPLAKAGVKIINLHPSLPEAFKGTNAIERAHAAWLEGKIEKSGIMIHEVILAVDEGQPLLVVEIPFVKGEDEDLERFEQKVHEVEWKAIVRGTKMAIERIV